MADISYTPTTWADGSEGGTPIDASKLNNIESGIVDAVAAIGPNDTTADGTLKAQIDALGDSVAITSGSVTFASGYTYHSDVGYYLFKFSNTVFYLGSAAPSSGFFTSQYPTVATMPAGWAPGHKVAAPCAIVGSGWAQPNNGNGNVRIDTDGSVRLYLGTGYSQGVGCTWCIAYTV